MPRSGIDTPTDVITYGFLVAVEDEIPVTKTQVEEALQAAFVLSKVDVGELGPIDCYSEDGILKGPSAR